MSILKISIKVDTEALEEELKDRIYMRTYNDAKHVVDDIEFLIQFLVEIPACALKHLDHTSANIYNVIENAGELRDFQRLFTYAINYEKGFIK